MNTPIYANSDGKFSNKPETTYNLKVKQKQVLGVISSLAVEQLPQLAKRDGYIHFIHPNGDVFINDIIYILGDEPHPNFQSPQPDQTTQMAT